MSCAQNETIVIVYSHNTNGILENCDCPDRSYGALEKRAALIDSIRKSEKNILLLDTGDILDIQRSHLLHKYIARVYDYIAYDYWTPGDQDFIEGTDFFLNDLLKISAQMLSSNIRYKDNAIGQLYAIRKFGKIRIGITGTIRDDLHHFLDRLTNVDFKFENQFSSLDPLIRELSEKTDYIILLSHSGIDQDRKMAKKFPAIDLIIGGHSQTILERPEKSGSTYITQVGESGYRIGIFKIVFNDNKIDSIEPSVVLLTKGMSENSTVVEMIKNYHQERLAK
jgi:2',3'-cyclic-nucleotide 2'-phosphodiesterase (5'-nucleotidase family)